LSCLQLTTVNDGGLVLGVDGTAAGASSLKGPDNLHGLIVSDLAEDDVATVEPRGDDSGDEKLRAVGVGAGVGHGEQTRAVVLQVEVLIGELLTVDRLTTGAVTTGEVTTLEHEVRDDTVERRALVTETLLAGAELAEVLGGLGDLVIVEVEVDATGLAGPFNVEENLAVNHGCG
jgi:hypothetical protein